MSVWERMPGVGFPVFDDVTPWPPESPDEVTGLKVQARKVHEEAGELMVAACDLAKLAGQPGEAEARARMVDELADLMQALVNLKYAFCIEDGEIAGAALDCWGRNRDRGRFHPFGKRV